MRRAEDKRLTVRLDDELARRFSDFKRAHSMSDSDALRTLLAWSLERSGDPVARAALAIQGQFCAQLSRDVADLQATCLSRIRALGHSTT